MAVHSMTDIGIVLAVLAMLCIAYPHVIYPVLLWCLHRGSRKPVTPGIVTDRVTVVIAAHNERNRISSCLMTLRASTSYPERIDVIIADDGSTDGTAQVVTSIAPTLLPMQVRVLSCERGGKNAALSSAMQHVSTDIVAFADADVQFGAAALDALLAQFDDPIVGAVISTMDRAAIPHDDQGATQEALYRRIEGVVNVMEGEISSTVTSNGAFYGVRRMLLVPIPDGRVADDWWNVLCAIPHGKRVVIAKDSKIVEYRPNSMAREFRRTIRTASAGMRCLWSMRKLLLPSYGFTSWFLWSHRVMRWAGPWFFLLLAISTFMVREHATIFGILFCGQLTLIVGSVLGYVAERINKRVPLLGVMQYVLLMNTAFLVASIKAVRGVALDTWTPSSDESST
ncbi:MAG: glycosyltransferase [Candidatus Kapabacteria bacterium]|nr:glycosyltransferase [Candidatus Kapabacteria bacterium]